jgi:hypothetical protein
LVGRIQPIFNARLRGAFFSVPSPTVSGTRSITPHNYEGDKQMIMNALGGIQLGRP